MRVRFGGCLLDTGTRELFRAGAPVRLPAKTFRLLEILLERRPKAVSKEELIERLWPGLFVADGNLARVVAELREAIGEDAAQRQSLRTIHGFGYAFSGIVEDEKEPPPIAAVSPFRLLWGEREIALHEGENILGRDRDATAHLDVGSVSRHHARILVSGGTARLEDLGSKNGTFLLGERLTKPRDLEDRDEIRIGSVPLTFRRSGLDESTETGTRP